MDIMADIQSVKSEMVVIITLRTRMRFQRAVLSRCGTMACVLFDACICIT